MAETAEVNIGGFAYPVASDSSGRRGIVRNRRPSNTDDPGRIRREEWAIATPIGNSLYSTSGMLGVDYAKNLETRFPRRLFSAGKRTAVDPTTKDPKATQSAKFGGPKFGALATKFGGAVAGQTVQFFDEQQGYLFAHRGRICTQIRLSDWTVIASHTFDATVKGAANWRDRGWVGLGGTAPIQKRSGASTTGATYADTEDAGSNPIYGKAMAVGSDRLWYVVADPAGTDENKITYTLDDFTTSAREFLVGDQRRSVNGIGPFGPFTMIGTQIGPYSFTDQGKPIPLSRALIGHISDENGVQWADPGWRWNYYIADTGLRATNGSTDNAVGIGERMPQFTGHGGVPTAIWAERGELWVAYDYEGDAYLYRCTFGPETAATGQPLMYPWRYLADTDVEAIFSSNTPTNPVMVWGEGTGVAYETISRDGRDDLFASRLYDIGGGEWNGTTYDLEPHVLKRLRMGRLRTKGLTSGSSWAVAWSMDDGAYVTTNTITEDGYHTLLPVNGTTPITGLSGRRMKPRLVQVAGGAGADTTPPEIEGTFEAVWDERPEYIEEVTVSVGLGDNPYGAWERLKAQEGSETAEPVTVSLPGDKGSRLAMVASVGERKDGKGDGVETCTVLLHIWDVS